MANSVYIMESCNLFCGDHDPENSKHLTLEEYKLPDLQEILVDHNPGGARIAVEFAVGVQKLEQTFKLKGWDMDLLRQFGAGSTLQKSYTGYGVIRDKRTGRAIEARSLTSGRLSKIAPDAFQRGESMSHDYALNEITHYELHFDGAEEFYWDFWTNTLRIGGNDPDPDTNRILRIAGS